jgi:redox-sensitive bicupin YhaK (pirin superfamily)
MSNLETEPAELECTGTEPVLADPAVGADSIGAETRGATSAAIEVLEPRDVPLGGPRAMSVRRTLPQRKRSLIGAWCFVDHYGPDDVAATGGMVVPPHPHTGLQTVSWLFAGEVDHRDSVGSHAMVRPGELNLMTAGRGIQHSEVSTPQTTTLHGAQLWVALPEATRNAEPFFEHYVPAPVAFGDATVRVFLGSLIGQTSTATAFSPLVGAQIDLPAGASVDLPIDPAFEHGVLVDAGELRVQSESVAVDHLGYLARGQSTLRLEAGAMPVRAILIGGTPLGERIVMWWNFVGRSHEEIVQFRTEWQDQVIERGTADGRFGAISDYDGRPLPAPEMPTVRLKPRA